MLTVAATRILDGFLLTVELLNWKSIFGVTDSRELIDSDFVKYKSLDFPGKYNSHGSGPDASISIRCNAEDLNKNSTHGHY